MSLTFAEKAHRYRLDGQHVSGVTTLISGGLPKPALLKWAPKTVAEWVADHPDEVADLRAMGRGPMVAALKETPWAERDAAANRGSEVHDLAERLVHGESVDVPEEIAGHVSACASFLDDFAVQPLLVEAVVGHRAHWWAGRLDLIGRLPDGRTVLVDWKTSRSGIYGETALQLAAYRHAEFYVCAADDHVAHVGQYAEHPLPEVDDCWGVHLTADGYSVIPLDAGEDTYKEFRHIARVATFATQRLKGLVGEPLTAPVLETTS